MVVTGEPQAIVTNSAPNHLPAWQALQAHQIQVAPLHMRELFAGDPDRLQRFSLQACDLFLDYSKNRITADTMVLLVELARQCGVEAWRDRMFAGDMVNESEHRAALHVALRAPAGQPFPSPAGDVMPAVAAARRRLGEMCAIERYGQPAIDAEIVGFREARSLMMPLGDLRGVQVGAAVYGELSKLCLVLVVSDQQAPQAVETILQAAKTGHPGDGRIFISEVKEAYTIRTGKAE